MEQENKRYKEMAAKRWDNWNRTRQYPNSDSPEYRCFSNAKDRCTNPNNNRFQHYGGRGIKFLFSSFEEFYNSVGKRPSAGFSLDRIDNEGDYEFGNVRWSTSSEQHKNQRKRYVVENIPDYLLIAEAKRRGLI